MQNFIFSKVYDSPVKDVFDWHKNILALERITPSWDNILFENRSTQTNNFLQDGKLTLIQEILPFIKLKWVIKHSKYIENESFYDEMLKGPFKSWKHKHVFEELNSASTLIKDEISFSSWINIKKLNEFIVNKIKKSFNYRSMILEHDLKNKIENTNENYVLMTGATGAIGQSLMSYLNSLGYKIIFLKYSKSSINAPVIEEYVNDSDDILTIKWNPYHKNTLELPKSISKKIKFLINLAGENILGLWTKSKKRKISNSRIQSTRSLYRLAVKSNLNFDCCIHSSAIGFYGSNPGIDIDEGHPTGKGFLALTTNLWEKEQDKFRDLTKRNIHLRIGNVLSYKGGIIGSIKTPFKLGLPGYVGNGENYLNWISLEDILRIIGFSFCNKTIDGPVNAVSPNPIKSKYFFSTVARKFGWNFTLKIPAILPKLFLKELVEELVLVDQSIKPKKLIHAKYEFFNTDLNKALDNILGS